MPKTTVLDFRVCGGSGFFSATGKKLGEFIAAGELVPDEIMIAIMSGEMKNTGPRWLLDGTFPLGLCIRHRLREGLPFKRIILLMGILAT